jgi:hypothetical protein
MAVGDAERPRTFFFVLATEPDSNWRSRLTLASNCWREGVANKAAVVVAPSVGLLRERPRGSLVRPADVAVTVLAPVAAGAAVPESIEAERRPASTGSALAERGATFLVLPNFGSAGFRVAVTVSGTVLFILRAEAEAVDAGFAAKDADTAFAAAEIPAPIVAAAAAATVAGVVGPKRGVLCVR